MPWSPIAYGALSSKWAEAALVSATPTGTSAQVELARYEGGSGNLPLMNGATADGRGRRQNARIVRSQSSGTRQSGLASGDLAGSTSASGAERIRTPEQPCRG